MNANVHSHSLVLDGVFTRSTPTAVPEFHPLPPPTDEEIAKFLEQVHDRVRRLLRRRGRLPEEPRDTDPVAEEMPLLAGFASASIQELVASGPRAGHPVRRLRSAAAVVDEAKRRCARLEGYSLHADVAVPAHARERLEHVCRYLLRPPLALERLTESAQGQLLYELPHPRRDGSAPGSAGLSWAALLKRVFALDVLQCPQCGGRRRIVGVYPGGARLHALLARLRLAGGRWPGRHGLRRNR